MKTIYRCDCKFSSPNLLSPKQKNSRTTLESKGRRKSIENLSTGKNVQSGALLWPRDQHTNNKTGVRRGSSVFLTPNSTRFGAYCPLLREERRRNGLQDEQVSIENHQITYKILNYPTQDRFSVNRDIYQALQTCSKGSDIHFTPAKSGNAEINIQFVNVCNTPYNCLNNMGLVPLVYFPKSMDSRGDNTPLLWKVNYIMGSNLYQVATYQFGHYLGIYDIPDGIYETFDDIGGGCVYDNTPQCCCCTCSTYPSWNTGYNQNNTYNDCFQSTPNNSSYCSCNSW